MTFRVRRILLMLASGSALAVAPLALVTVAGPGPAHAECTDGQAGRDGQCELQCPDGSFSDAKGEQCVDYMSAIASQLQALPPPPQFAGGIPSIPPPVALPDVVLPGIGVGLVPDVPIILQPQFPQVPPPQLPDLTKLPPPQLPDLTKLPPPQLPDLTKLPPPQLPPPPQPAGICGPELAFGFRPCV